MANLVDFGDVIVNIDKIRKIGKHHRGIEIELESSFDIRNNARYIYAFPQIVSTCSYQEAVGIIKKYAGYEQLEEENESLRQQIAIMPGGPEYLAAQLSFNKHKN